MKKILLFLFVCSSAFAVDPSYKVTEFKRIKSGGKIIKATLKVHCEKEGKTADLMIDLSEKEIVAYEQDANSIKSVAERICSTLKESVEKQIAESASLKTEEQHSQLELDLIVIDPSKVK